MNFVFYYWYNSGILHFPGLCYLVHISIQLLENVFLRSHSLYVFHGCSACTLKYCPPSTLVTLLCFRSLYAVNQYNTRIWQFNFTGCKSSSTTIYCKILSSAKFFHWFLENQFLFLKQWCHSVDYDKNLLPTLFAPEKRALIAEHVMPQTVQPLYCLYEHLNIVGLRNGRIKCKAATSFPGLHASQFKWEFKPL